MDTSQHYAWQQDQEDPLKHFRGKFSIPGFQGGESVYLCGNSLGLMPLSTPASVMEELEDWKNLGVEGHFHAKHPWMPYHEFLTENMAAVVGARPSEVVVMNSLTVNLHLMMVSFYRPQKNRFKILVDYSPFPSDRYAVWSQLKYHGYDPQEGMIELKPLPGTEIITQQQISEVLDEHGHEIALVLIGGVNYYTGQAYDLGAITREAHARGCMVGFDLAHAAGNIKLDLHHDGPDFAAWCTYKYLNSGPGSLSGCFVHERHHSDSGLHRFAGWWGHDKAVRFKMGDTFIPTPTAEGWQLSNPPILSMAAIRSSLDIFREAGMEALRSKSEKLTAYLAFMVSSLGSDHITVITPSDPAQRGCQLSLRMLKPDKRLFDYIMGKGVIADWREPDVIRVAPVPLYNTFTDVHNFVSILREGLHNI